MQQRPTRMEEETRAHREPTARRGGGALLLALAWLLLPASASGQAAQPESLDPLASPNAALFLRSAAGGPWQPAPLLESEVDLQVTGLVARGRVLQRFHNTSEEWLEGVYVFPLPDEAAVDHLDMRVGDRVIRGEIQERARARRRYARARREGRKASLVEQERPNVFTTSVANLGPGEILEVALEYQETLRFQESGLRLRFPMLVAPRYEAAGSVAVGPPQPQPAVWQGPAPEPALASLASPPARLRSPRLDPALGPVNPVRLRVEIEAGFPLARLESPTHVVWSERIGPGRHRVELRDYADRDFVLEWQPEPGSAPRAALFVEERGDENHVLLMMLPPAPDKAVRPLRRELIFVVDTSGSMGGAAIRQAREALRLALGQLGLGDRFNLIRFSSGSEALFPAPVPVGPEHIEQALRWVDGLRANGGTEMLPALEMALADDSGQDGLRQVVFVTDGSVANEESLFGLIHARLGRSRLFPVGIGAAPNGYLLRRAARFGRGTYTFVASPGELEARMGELFAKLESPYLSDIELLWPDAVEMWPKQVPDLYAGEPVVVSARIPRFVGEVHLRGRRGDRPFELSLPLRPDQPERGLGVLWARRKISALMEGLVGGADPSETRDAVVAVAKEFHLVSRYTSLVAVDVMPSRPSSEGLSRGDVPTHLPAGFEPPAAAGVLPSTGTPAALLRGLGGLLLATALGMRRRRSGRAAAEATPR